MLQIVGTVRKALSQGTHMPNTEFNKSGGPAGHQVRIL